MLSRMARHRWDPVCRPPTDLVAPVPVDPTGIKGPTRGQAAGPSWRRVAAGLYVPATASLETPEQRILEASARLPAGGAITAWAACRLHGSTFHDGLEADGATQIPVPLAVGPRGGVRRDRTVSVHFARFSPADWTVIQGIPTMRPVRATFDEMRRRGDVREAVVVLDMMAAAKLVSGAQLATYAASHRGAHRVGIVLDAVTYHSEHSRSPNEVRLRLVAELEAGFPRLLVNCPIHDPHGRLLGVADLFDIVAGLVIEFDGADHRSVARHSRDILKDEDLRACRLEVIRVTGTQLGDTATLVPRLRAARARSAFEQPADRLWIVRPKADVLDAQLREQIALGELMAKWDRELRGA